MILVPLPSQAASGEMCGASLVCVSLCSLLVGQLFLELDLVIPLNSNWHFSPGWKSCCSGQACAFECKKKRVPRAQNVNVCVKAVNLSTVGYLDKELMLNV